ncbi:MAG: CDP-glucose 4,6-dehydratase [Bacteroidales bacterium]|nr:CDP-glucose 4,6-dehydratase [Bacteroidales bacterium]
MKAFYQNKKVFITGHTGFKGSWLTALLYNLGAEITGYALSPKTQPNLFQAIEGNSLCKSIIGDIRDVVYLHSQMKKCQPDIVFHLAAQPIVRTSYEIPAETFEINSIGTANVLDGIRLLDNPCVAVMITTDKVYENIETGQAYKETDRLGGYDPYSASKACAELVIDSYRKSFFNPKHYERHQKSIASARAGNVIGGGDWAPDRLLPDIIRALAQNEAIQIRNPQAVRPWQHVLEPLFGYLLLAMKMYNNPLHYATAYNFGPNPQDVLSVKEMTEMAVNIWGSGNIIFPELLNQPHEASLLSLDINKAKDVLHWEPKLNAKSALELTLQWYKYYYENKTYMFDFTLNQINTYFLK